MAQLGQQGQGIGGGLQPQLLAGRQHQLAQVTAPHQFEGLIQGLLIAHLPGGLDGQWCRPQLGGTAGAIACGGAGFQLPGLLPQFFGQPPGRDAATQSPLQPQPAMVSLATQLPAGQHGLHPRGAVARQQGAGEEGKGQQQSGPGQRRAGQGPAGQAAEGESAEALGQLKAARAAEFEVVGATAGRQAEAWTAIPEEAKAFAILQLGQHPQGIDGGQGHGQADQPVFVVTCGQPGGLRC